jgi:hypothetical protein
MGLHSLIEEYSLARKADSLTAICELIVQKCGSLDVSQPYGPPWSVTGIALRFYLNRLARQMA